MKQHKFPERLKELRRESDLLQIDLANKLKISKSTVSGWEVGRNQPDYDILFVLSDLFNVSLDYLLGKTEF